MACKRVVHHWRRRVMAGTTVGLLVALWLGAQAQERALAGQQSMTQQAGTIPAVVTLTNFVYLPLIQVPPPFDIHNRQSVLDFYTQQYLVGVPTIDWTGSIDTCTPGTTSQAFRDAVLRRVNYFRAMAGVPNKVTLYDTYNTKAQAAALMMSANNDLNHTPPNTWQCYSTDGNEGAGNSNLSLGTNGPDAISGQLQDGGDSNYFAGHRRGILYPQSQQMGTGNVPATGGHQAANALWVYDDNFGLTRPPVRDDFVAWPPAGYVPYTVVYARWSFGHPDADFSGATVSMTQGASSVSVTLESVLDG
jgi:uncharacterized protein YkwD